MTRNCKSSAAWTAETAMKATAEIAEHAEYPREMINFNVKWLVDEGIKRLVNNFPD